LIKVQEFKVKQYLVSCEYSFIQYPDKINDKKSANYAAFLEP